MLRVSQRDTQKDTVFTKMMKADERGGDPAPTYQIVLHSCFVHYFNLNSLPPEIEKKNNWAKLLLRASWQLVNC